MNRNQNLIVASLLLVSLVSGCSRKRAGSLEDGAKVINDLEKANALASEPSPNHLQTLVEAYDQNLKSALITPDWGACPVSCLNTLFDSLVTVSFYSNSSEHVLSLEKVFQEISARGAPTPRQIQKMHGSYIIARMFDKARTLEDALGRDSLERLPEIIRDASLNGPKLYRIENQGKTLRLEPVSLAGAHVVILTHPLCGFTRRAFKDIETDAALKSVMASNAILISSPNGQLEIAEFLKWNRAHPAFPLRLVHSIADWPSLDEWNSIPIFYFLKDGKLLYKKSGWPSAESKNELYHGMKLLGLMK